MTKAKLQKLYNLVTSKHCTDSDIEDFCDKHKVAYRDAFHTLAIWCAPECCQGCKHIDLYPSMPPCASCSRGKEDYFEDESIHGGD